jgi:hypothetical protein
MSVETLRCSPPGSIKRADYLKEPSLDRYIHELTERRRAARSVSDCCVVNVSTPPQSITHDVLRIANRRCACQNVLTTSPRAAKGEIRMFYSITCHSWRPTWLPGSLLVFLFVTSAGIAQDDIEERAVQRMRLPSNAVAKYEWPTQSSGILSGTHAVANARSSTGDQFKFGYIVNIGVWELSKDYGTSITWEFITDGAMQYNYNVPFAVQFEFPREVHPGQRIFLRPFFTWGRWNPRSIRAPAPPSMQVTQDYRYSHKTAVWADAPDGLDETRTNFTQEATKARIYVKIPVLPFMNAVTGTYDCTFAPCNQGGGSYGGSYTKLGGTGRLATNLNQTYEESDTTISLLASGTKERLWKQGHEQFDLTATVLNMIPTVPTEAAGAGIRAVREIGGFRLRTQLDGDIRRQDVVRLEVLRQPFVDVPEDLQGDTWRFEIPVKLAYRAKFESYFWYPLGYSVVFDMKGIDPKTLTNPNLVNVRGSDVDSGWVEKEGTFVIKGAVPAGPRPSLLPNVAKESAPSLLMKRTLSQPPALAAVRMARPAETQRLISTASTPAFPTPVAPQPGQFTVVVGRFPEAQARSVVADLGTKRVKATLLVIRGSTDKIVSCGSFAKEADATLMSDLLKEMLGVNSVVTTDPYNYRPETKQIQAPARIRR